MTESNLVGRHIYVNNSDQAYAGTLDALVQGGLPIVSGVSSSTAAGKASREYLNFSVVVNSPRDRILRNPARRLNLPAAVARFVWMMAGSDRLADIAFYEPKVRFFTDDGISVPGSNYGQRILQPRPGLNQLVAAIERLKSDPQTRRAAISIYHPEDAVRDSRDIPCAFGVFYHIRQDRLYATTVMRSNNAFVLLPYNLFEFSLLAEIVAVELNTALGSLTHFAASMHVFEENIAQSATVISAAADLDAVQLATPAVPSTPRPVDQVRELVKLEAELRHGSAGINEGNIEEWVSKGETVLHQYWRQLYYLLLLHVAQKNRSTGALDRLASVIESPWREGLPEDAFKVSGQGYPTQELSLLELGLDSEKVVPISSTRAHRELRTLAERWEARTGENLAWREFVVLEDRLGERLAARGDEASISEEELVELIDQIRK